MDIGERTQVITAIIDGDILCYQAASKAEELIQWDDDIWTLHANINTGRVLLKDYIETMASKVKVNGQTVSDFVVVVSIGKTFRHELLPSYKGQRDPRKKPILVSALRDWILEAYGERAYCIPPMEADDVMGILATDPEWRKGTTKVIVSLDKDFKTIPAIFYDYGKDETHELTEDDANHHWMLQTLTGDYTDNYAGCPAVGAVTAAKLLPEPAPLEEMWEVVLGTFIKKGMTEEDAILQARMARILRHGDYDFNTKEIKLWQPTT